MLSNLKLSMPLIVALSISCIPQFSYTKFITLENEEQFTSLIQNKQPFVLQFSATWCHACTMVKQAVEEVAQEPEFDTITVARVDIDKLQSLVSAHQIKSIPTFLYFNNGSKIDIPAPANFKPIQYQGFNSNKPKESLRDNIRKYLMNKTIENNIATEPDSAHNLIYLIRSFVHKIIEGIKNLFS